MGNLQWRIGDVTVTRVVESEASIPPEGLLPAATAEGLARHRDWLVPHFLDDDGNLRLSIHALLVESQGQRIVVDTCVGNRVIPEFEGLRSDTPFLDYLADAGFAREQVDQVICTHLHFDHVGWNTMRDGDEWVPTFPHARYVFAKQEWAHWDAEGQSQYAVTLDDAVRPVIAAGLADFVDGDHRVNDEIWLEPTPGHTPGHVAVRILSQGEEALITGDLAHHPVQWAEPAWASSADIDTAGSTETRRRLLREHADRPVLVIGTHFPPPCAGYLESDGESFRFRVVG